MEEDKQISIALLIIITFSIGVAMGYWLRVIVS